MSIFPMEMQQNAELLLERAWINIQLLAFYLINRIGFVAECSQSASHYVHIYLDRTAALAQYCVNSTFAAGIECWSLLKQVDWKDFLIYLPLFLVPLLALGYYLAPSREERYKAELQSCRKAIVTMLTSSSANPILLRLAWSDAVTFDNMLGKWPLCRGVNGSIRFDTELEMPANAGLAKAVSMLANIKSSHKRVSWADLIQLAAVVAVEHAGGPVIGISYGRIDVTERDYKKLVLKLSGNSSSSSSSSNSSKSRSSHSSVSQRSPQEACVASIRNSFPCPMGPFPDGSPSSAVHMRNVFYRLGMSNRDTVALCGAHTLGRAFKDRTGVCSFSSGNQGATIYTQPTAKAHGDISTRRGGGTEFMTTSTSSTIVSAGSSTTTIGMAGGCSWTRNWLQFDNSYYKRVFEQLSGAVSVQDMKQLLWLPCDQALYDCPEFRPYFIRYANSQDEFFRDYSTAHIKMSELGAQFQFKIKM